MPEAYYQNPAFGKYVRKFEAGSTVLRQGGRDGQLAILVRGVLEATKDGYLVGEIVEPGSIIGEMSLILGKPHTTNVAALTPAEIIIVPRNELSSVSRNIPEFTRLIMRTLAERLDQANNRIAELENSFDQLYNRVDSDTDITRDSTRLFSAKTLVVSNPEDLIPQGMAKNSSPADCRTTATPAFEMPAEKNGKRQPLNVELMLCPVSAECGPFPGYLLKKGVCQHGRDHFGITEYRNSATGFADVDYTLQEVHVCPACLFASNRADNFWQPGDEGGTGCFSIRGSVREMLDFGLDVRKAMLATLPDQRRLFSPERGVREAVVAYELALMTARAFFESDRELFSSWGFRLIVYNLKLAQIHRRYRSAETERICLSRAYDLVRETMEMFSGIHRYYSHFLAVALALQLEGNAAAELYLKSFAKFWKDSSAGLQPEVRKLCEEYFYNARAILDAGLKNTWTG